MPTVKIFLPWVGAGGFSPSSSRRTTAEVRAFMASIQHAAPVEANAGVARAALATALRIEAALG